ncbi:hypothetical protein [Brevibacillus reuszeri]|uniref:hypothetical protein n=1 Tax=Brevibacillus reuszeri TaxID=54915 RepID=UPI003D1D22F4
MMEICYEIKEVELSGGRKTLAIVFPDGFESLSDFLISDIDDYSSKWYIELIDKVTAGSSLSERFRGNACRLEIYSDTTHVINYLFENLEDSHLYSFKCSLPTVLLKKLIQEWTEQLNRFKTNNSSS